MAIYFRQVPEKQPLMKDLNWPITVSCKRHGPPEFHTAALGSTRPRATNPHSRETSPTT